MFHAVLYSELNFHLSGSSIMPLFFMLSGFSLAVAYGNKFPSSTSDDKVFPQKQFYWNRWVRTMPSYYIVNAFAFVPAWYGYTGLPPMEFQNVFRSIWSQSVVTVVPVSTWLCGVFGLPLDGPAWTISTLLMMWILFPYSMHKIKKMDDLTICKSKTQMYWL